MSIPDGAEDAIRIAGRARVFLEESIFQDAWRDLEEMLVARWRNSPHSRADEREEAYRTLRVMDGLRNVLDGYVQSGQIALHDLEQFARDRVVAGQ